MTTGLIMYLTFLRYRSTQHFLKDYQQKKNGYTQANSSSDVHAAAAAAVAAAAFQFQYGRLTQCQNVAS